MLHDAQTEQRSTPDFLHGEVSQLEEGMPQDELWIVDYAWQLGEDGLVYTRSWLSQ